MSSRSYLSIGDVLTLLRQEFPDVTISKIRFLESQGLVNPERTPSGYRKFYEHDVERLRWVLRQQRENFLPLKVIKDRLDDEGDEATETEAAHAGGQAAEEPVLVGQRASSDVVGSASAGGAVDRPAGDPSTPTRPTGSALPGIETGTATANGAPTPRGAPAGVPRAAATAAPARTAATRQPAASSRPATADGPAPSPTRSNKGATAAHAGRSTSGPAGGGAASASEGVGSDPVAGGAAGIPRAATGAAGEDHGPTGTTPTPPPPPSAPGGGRTKGSRAAPPPSTEPEEAPVGGPIASLSIEELSAASGLDVSVLEDLVDFGLLSGTRVVGHVYFDDEALAVAKLAAGFARFGVEPRHLRLYKNAADREAGFVEQIVIPLVRQRNPEARVRAQETVDELANLGQQLKASLLRSALANLLDG